MLITIGVIVALVFFIGLLGHLLTKSKLKKSVVIVENRLGIDTKKSEFCFYSKVAGSSYRQDAIEKLVEGELVFLQREPDNDHDPDAIAVVRTNGDQIGYLPAGSAPTLSGELDSGRIYFGQVKDLTGGGDKKTGVNLKIYTNK